MYHRFGEGKYPSTNIGMKEFKSHIEMIKSEGIKFIHPNNLESEIKKEKKTRKALLTIDDGFSSFYNNAWPLLKNQKIPFLLFISTREIGKYNYMTWDQIKEIHESELGIIGNHSDSHEYLIDRSSDEIISDLKKSKDIFRKNLGENSPYFSYPFGEYSLEFKEIVKNLGFKFAFGQHSGVIDETKDNLEYPRFPINEKYGKLDRFSTILKTLPFKYEYIKPQEKYLQDKDNPPIVKIKFYNLYKNINSINCFSNEQDKWRNSIISFEEKNLLEIRLEGKFTTERGRINCSLKEGNFFRWLGVQFVIADK